jgi:hypothetical protein
MRSQKVRIVQAVAEQEAPADLEGWPAVRDRLEVRRTARSRPAPRTFGGAGVRPVLRLGWAGILLALFLILGAAAYAGSPVISRLFSLLPGWQHVSQTNLAQEMDLSQTSDGVTVTLERAYADANQILIGYTVQRGGSGLEPGNLTLTDEQGHAFPPNPGGFGVSGSSDLLGVTLPPGEESTVMAFDADGVQGAPAELHLRLSVSLARVVAVEQDPMLVPTGQESRSTVAGEYRSEVEGDPIVFDFSVPFHPGRTIQVGRTARAAGVAVRLERVVVTSSEARATLCFAPPQYPEADWMLIPELHAGGQVQRGMSGNAISQVGTERCYVDHFPADLDAERGQWTLAVTELIGFGVTRAGQPVEGMGGPDKQIRIAGPWVFRFPAP